MGLLVRTVQTGDAIRDDRLQEVPRKGFRFIGLSFDADLQGWKAAIEAWDMPWIHLSDLQYWQSKAAKIYDIHAIPDNILIDPSGTIVARGLRGPQLEAYLSNVFK